MSAGATTAKTERKRRRHQARVRQSAAPLDPGWLLIIAACALLLAAPWFLSDFLVGLAVTHNLVLHFIVTGFVAVELLRSHRQSVEAPREDMGTLTMSLALLAGAHLLSLVGSVYVRATLLETLRVLDCAAFACIVARNCKTFDQSLAIALAIALSAAIVGRQAATEWRMAADPNSRVFVSFQNPNLLAFYLAMALPLWCGAAAALRARERRQPDSLRRPSRTTVELTICGLAGFLIAAGLWATGSRGGLGAASGALALCVLGLLLIGGSGRATKLLALAIALTGLIAVAGVMMKISQRAKQAGTSVDHSAGFRRYTWQSTVRMIRARPLLGAGAGTFQHVFPRYAVAGFTRHAHQNFLQVAAEQGVVGLASFLVFLAAASRACLRGLRNPLAKESKFLLCGIGTALLAFAVHSLVDSGWYSAVITLNVLVMGALALRIEAHGEPQVNAALTSATVAGGSRKKIILCLATGVLIVTTAYATRAWSAEQHYLEAGRLREAGALTSMLEEARAATLTDARSGEYRLLHGRALRELYLRGEAQLDAVLAEFRAAERLMPTASGPPLMQGLLLKHAREYRRARVALERAVRNEPNNTSALWALAGTFVELGDRAAARRRLLQIADLNEGVWGKYPALPQFVDLNVARAYAQLGDMAREDGDLASAKSWWRKARAVVESGIALDKHWSLLRAAGVEVPAAPREEWDALKEELETKQTT